MQGVAWLGCLAYRGRVLRSEESQSSARIVVAGAGFVGGALALALARLAPKVCRVTVVDAVPPSAERAADERGLALSPASRNLLNAIGLWPRLEPSAQAMDAIEITDSPLDATLRPHLLGFAPDPEGDGVKAWLVEAGVLLETITDAVHADPGVEVIAPDTVQNFNADAHGATVNLDSGRALRAALLVAADGKKSKLREQAGIKCIGWSYQQMGIVATVAHERPHNGLASPCSSTGCKA